MDEFEETVLAGIRAFAPVIDVTRFAVSGGWTVDETSARYEDVLWRHPEIFWVNKVRQLAWRTAPNGALAHVEITNIPYACTPQDLPIRTTELEDILKTAHHSSPPPSPLHSTCAARARHYHDFLRDHCAYDKAGLSSKTPDYRTAYDALVKGRAVCEGYAMAYRLLLDRAGIESRIVVSEKMNHCWNLVNVDGAWLHVDVTRDDPTHVVRLRLREKREKYRYCLVSDEVLRRWGYSGWTVRV